MIKYHHLTNSVGQIFLSLPNFLLSLAANACEQTRASRLKKERGVLAALLCPPHHPFSCPHVLRGQKTGRWVALVESPSRGREPNSLLFLIRDLDCKIPVEDAPVVDLSGLMRVGCRSGYYRQYRWLPLKKRRRATSMSRPPLLLCPSRRGDITIRPELYQQACCIGLHLYVVHRGPGHIHTSAS